MPIRWQRKRLTAWCLESDEVRKKSVCRQSLLDGQNRENDRTQAKTCRWVERLVGKKKNSKKVDPNPHQEGSHSAITTVHSSHPRHTARWSLADMLLQYCAQQAASPWLRLSVALLVVRSEALREEIRLGGRRQEASPRGRFGSE